MYNNGYQNGYTKEENEAMNKIAEDIIFLKDNLGKGDRWTRESIEERKSIERDKEMGWCYNHISHIATIIVAVLIFFFLGKLHYSAMSEGNYMVALIFVIVLFLFWWKQPIFYIVAAFMTGFVVELIAPNYTLTNIEWWEITPLIVVVAVITSVVLKVVWKFMLKDEMKGERSKILAPEKEDELTKKLYQMMFEEYGVHVQHFNDAFGKNGCFVEVNPELYEYDMRQVRDIERMRRRDRWLFVQGFDKVIKYPVAHVPEKNEVNREQLMVNLLNSTVFQSIIDKMKISNEKGVVKLLLSKENALFVDNDEREEYFRVIQELLESIPQVKFNIRAVSKLGEKIFIEKDIEGERHYLKFPNLKAAVTPVLDSEACKKIVDLNEVYETNLKAFNSDLKGTLIGAEGEREVAKTLKDFEQLVGREKMRILPNIRMEPNGQSVESDFIVVCQYGVFALEVKNLGSTGSYNITVEKDGLWKKVMKNGHWKEMPDSISRQNERHLMGIEQVINSKMGNSTENWIEAKSLIVFANNVVGIRNYSDNIIIRDSEIMTEIRKNPIYLNEQQINQIAEILIAESLPAKKYKMENWMNRLVAVHLELAQRTQDIYPYLQDYIDIMTAFNYKMNLGFSLPDYQVSQEIVSLEDDESEYQQSAQELEEERRAEQQRQMEEQRLARKREESYQYNNQSVYEEEPTWEERFHTYDAYQYGTAINMDYQDSCDKNKNQ